MNQDCIVHGCHAAAVLDTACGCAIHSLLPPYTGFTTFELKIAYHRAMNTQTGAVRAEGRAISNGRREAFSEAKLFDATGRLLASATSTLLVIPASA